MGMLGKTREFIRVLGEFSQILPRLSFKMAEDNEKTSLGLVFQNSADRSPDSLMLKFEERSWTYGEFNSEVNQLARFLMDQGVSRGTTVALFMENRPEFLLSLLALAKLGATASLINSSLSGAALVHCIQVTGASRIIVGTECCDALAESKEKLPLRAGSDYFWFANMPSDSLPDWATDAGRGMTDQSVDNLAVTADINAGENALYVFTSGTTGLPKAAIVAHRRILAAGMGVGRIGFRIKSTDRLYLCLPLYHLTGLGAGLVGFLALGASIYLRRGFSASKFWTDIQSSQCNCFIYVGELCRFLALQPESPAEKNNPLEKMMGNGLRPDVWDQFRVRFSVNRICEIYGSSEGNVTIMNFLNKEKTIGTPLNKTVMVRYDTRTDEIVRDETGRCIVAKEGEAGLLLSEINEKARFDGYTNSQETERKIVRHVHEPNDRWFNTGDLLRQIDVGFAMGMKHYQFVDRTGDTFRWRAENVSTNEVAEILNQHPQINMANVYGVEVEGTEGRAGMVAFELAEGDNLDLESFQRLVAEHLPDYAQPVFIRILRSIETTATFKLLKGDLRNQAYHLSQIQNDTVYVRKPHSDVYEELEQPFYNLLLSGKAGY